jgi:hypothetical protein
MLFSDGYLTHCIYKHSGMDISVKIKSCLFYLLDETMDYTRINGDEAYVQWVDDVTVLFWWLQMHAMLIMSFWAGGWGKM